MTGIPNANVEPLPQADLFKYLRFDTTYLEPLAITDRLVTDSMAEYSILSTHHERRKTTLHIV